MGNGINLKIAEIRAVIFDMDGTMVNNAHAHKQAWREFLAQHDIELSEKDFKKKVSGKKNDQIFKNVFGARFTVAQSLALADEKEALYRKLYSPEIVEVPGLTSIIRQLQKKGIMLAIATTAPEKNRTFVLESLGIDGYFGLIKGDEHVVQGKPHPEIYLTTAKELGLDASQCLVFEDSPPGVRSAKSAGMKVVAILTSHSKDELPEADYYANDFNEIDVT